MILAETPYKNATLPQRFTYPSPGFSHYWKQGAGLKMLQLLKEVPTQQQVESHAQLLTEADDLADAVIKEVFEKMGFSAGFEND